MDLICRFSYMYELYVKDSLFKMLKYLFSVALLFCDLKNDQKCYQNAQKFG